MGEPEETAQQLLARFRALLGDDDYEGLQMLSLDYEEMFDAIWATLEDAGRNSAEIFSELELIE